MSRERQDFSHGSCRSPIQERTFKKRACFDGGERYNEKWKKERKAD